MRRLTDLAYRAFAVLAVAALRPVARAREWHTDHHPPRRHP